jgi:hypothetical protein
MASARRTAQALHPTNLHVNVKLFPRDTVQSRLPDPEWLEQWLDKQIDFDAVWENKVVERSCTTSACCSNAASRACRSSIATARK